MNKLICTLLETENERQDVKTRREELKQNFFIFLPWRLCVLAFVLIYNSKGHYWRGIVVLVVDLLAVGVAIRSAISLKRLEFDIDGNISIACCAQRLAFVYWPRCRAICAD